MSNTKIHSIQRGIGFHVGWNVVCVNPTPVVTDAQRQRHRDISAGERDFGLRHSGIIAVFFHPNTRQHGG